MLDFLKKPIEDVHIQLPTAELVFNHRLKLAFLYLYDPDTPVASFEALDKHLARKKYHLQIFVPTAAPTPPPHAANKPTT